MQRISVLSKPAQKTFEEVVQIMTNHQDPQLNQEQQDLSLKFNDHDWRLEESIAEYIAELQTIKFGSIRIPGFHYSYFTVRVTTICRYNHSTERVAISCIGVTTNVQGNDWTTNKLEQFCRDTITDIRQEQYWNMKKK